MNAKGSQIATLGVFCRRDLAGGRQFGDWRSGDFVLLRDRLSHKRTLGTTKGKLVPVISISCDGKLLALFPFTMNNFLRDLRLLADADTKSWLCGGSDPDDWDWNRGQH